MRNETIPSQAAGLARRAAAHALAAWGRKLVDDWHALERRREPIPLALAVEYDRAARLLALLDRGLAEEVWAELEDARGPRPASEWPEWTDVPVGVAAAAPAGGPTP